ncbi:MAG: DUF948 domain-containing protein [Proteobacteria bacterium]|nr:DUF948 domain-containing protein [Pseudomonadota bacterium]MBU4296288.1 DUF948 domain-containing protein [Pseudomonadota bacterium]MCG2748636.1 DUF948 domain-containing protein [Desulfobulbaceae bacterium]
MAISDIFFIIASVGIVILVATMVPVLYQLKRTAEKAETALEKINNEMEPLLHKTTEVTEELHILSVSLNEKIERTDRIIDTVQQAGDTLLNTASLIKETATPLIVQIGAISAGIGAFTNVFKKSKPSERRYFDE